MSRYFTPKNVARVLHYGQQAKNIWNSPGVRTIRGVAKTQRTRIAANRARNVRSKGFGGSSTAIYVGPFKKPMKAKTTQIASYLSQGVMEYKEVYGDINDPDCVYLTFSTYDQQLFIDTIFAALLKKLFKKAGINLDSMTQEIPGIGYNDSSGFTLTAVYKTGSGAIYTKTHIVLNNSSLQSLVAFDVCEFNVFYRALIEPEYTPANANFADGVQLERIILSQTTGNLTVAELNVMQEVLQLESYVTIAVQNRTKAGQSGTGDSETDRVDSQPLKGKLYEFSGGIPKERQKDYSLLNLASPSNGVQLVRAGQLDAAYKEPPPAKHFSNVTKASGQILQPGTIKKHYMKFYARGFLNNLMLRWKANRNAVGVPNQVSAPGKCCMFALEEVMNSGSANKITVNYEIDRKVGAKLITAKPVPMKPKFSESVFSNIVP